MKPVHERLQRMSISDPVTGCRNWQGHLRGGYGQITVGSRSDGTRKQMPAHRCAYELVHGPVPKGIEVCHHCDNRACINVGHLFSGTRQDNIDDREAKGRNVIVRGEQVGTSRLTNEIVMEMRRLHQSGLSCRKIAIQFGVHRRTATLAAKGRTWAHLPMPPAPEEGGKR